MRCCSSLTPNAIAPSAIAKVNQADVVVTP
jgi:hypothetical protein